MNDASCSAVAACPWDVATPFVEPVSPCDDDIDGLRHTNNAVYVRWCEAIAWAHSASLGLALADYQRLDRAMAIRHAEYDYLLPSLAGEKLLLATWLASSDGRITLERRFQLIRPSDGQTLLRGAWQLVCIELASGRPRRMPAEFSAAYLPAIVREDVAAAI